MQYFDNIYDFIKKYMQELTLAFCFACFVFLVIFLIVNLKRIKLDKELKAVITNSKNIDNDLTQIAKTLEEILTYDKDNVNACQSILSKVQAIIEVQSIAYSVNDGYPEDIRKQILSILTTARLESTIKRAELLDKINKLNIEVQQHKMLNEEYLESIKTLVGGE